MTKEEQRDYLREYRSLRKRLKICLRCGEKDERTMSVHSYCSICTEKAREYSKANPKSPEKKAEQYIRKKERWQKRKAEHRCPICNKELEAESKYILCPSCREKAKIKGRLKFKGHEEVTDHSTEKGSAV